MSRARDPFQQPNDHICPAKATIKVASVESGRGGQPNTFQVRASFIIKPLCSPSCPAPLPRILSTMDNEVRLRLRSTCIDYCQWAERDSVSSNPPVISPSSPAAPAGSRKDGRGVMWPGSGTARLHCEHHVGTLGFAVAYLINKY